MMFDLILDVMNRFPAKTGSIVPLGRGYFADDPGTSCLATMGLSPRDKIDSTTQGSALGTASSLALALPVFLNRCEPNLFPATEAAAGVSDLRYRLI